MSRYIASMVFTFLVAVGAVSSSCHVAVPVRAGPPSSGVMSADALGELYISSDGMVWVSIPKIERWGSEARNRCIQVQGLWDGGRTTWIWLSAGRGDEVSRRGVSSMRWASLGSAGYGVDERCAVRIELVEEVPSSPDAQMKTLASTTVMMEPRYALTKRQIPTGEWSYRSTSSDPEHITVSGVVPEGGLELLLTQWLDYGIRVYRGPVSHPQDAKSFDGVDEYILEIQAVIPLTAAEGRHQRMTLFARSNRDDEWVSIPLKKAEP